MAMISRITCVTLIGSRWSNACFLRRAPSQKAFTSCGVYMAAGPALLPTSWACVWPPSHLLESASAIRGQFVMNPVGFIAGSTSPSGVVVVRPCIHWSPRTTMTPGMFITSRMLGSDQEVAPHGCSWTKNLLPLIWAL